MKTFKEFLTEKQSTPTEKSAKAIETALSKNGIQYKRKNNIHDVVFTLSDGYKIVTDGQMIDLMKGSKDIDNWDNRAGTAQKAVEKYQSVVSD